MYSPVITRHFLCETDITISTPTTLAIDTTIITIIMTLSEEGCFYSTVNFLMKEVKISF